MGGEGLPIGRIVELVGPAAVGKTQLCLWCAVQVAVKHPHRSVLFISSSNSLDGTNV
jgi:RecA/RadA recombinase